MAPGDSDHTIEIENFFIEKGQPLWISVVQIRSREKIRTDHLQTIVAPRSPGTQHTSGSLDCLLDDSFLAL